MKKIAILLICLSVCVVTGCSSMTKPLYYSVGVKNKGKEMIVVDPFQITDGPVSIVDVGEVYPDGNATMAPFYTRPFQHVIVTWRATTTKSKGKAEAMLNLPKEFTKERGSFINFYIFPDTQKIDVAYEILNPKTGQTDTVLQPTATSQ